MIISEMDKFAEDTILFSMVKIKADCEELQNDPAKLSDSATNGKCNSVVICAKQCT